MNNLSLIIVGFGITGKSFFKYFKEKSIIADIIDLKDLSESDLNYLKDNNAQYFKYSCKEDLLQYLIKYDFIALSPGVYIKDILEDDFYKIEHKLISELDIFLGEYFGKKIFITGSIGKTSTTQIINHILNYVNYKIDLGGNIGIAVLDILQNLKSDKIGSKNRYALLELSSFQLEFTKSCKNDIAIITNIYNNHLDRHKSFNNYKNIKLKIVKDNIGISIVPIDIFDDINSLALTNVIFFSGKKIDIEKISNVYTIYYYDEGFIFRYKHGILIKLLDVDDFSIINNVSFVNNWLIIIALLEYLNIDLKILLDIYSIDISNHRLKLIYSYKNILFYDDSKSTVVESTIAAVDYLVKKYKKDSNIILLLGGTSKGVSRDIIFKKLKDYSKNLLKIISFGDESSMLKNFAEKEGFNIYSYNNLDDALLKSIDLALKCDKLSQILLSPSGASFDLFDSYKERGLYFQKLIKDFTQ